ncbi:SRP54-type protein [Lanmaoa asiatica]|nr:SRP54-type protein [Lanmaoa asiatica]
MSSPKPQQPPANSATDVPTSSPTAAQTRTIAGSVVGGVVFLALVMLAILLYLRARKRKRTPPSSEFMNSLRAGATPVLRLDSGAEYTPTFPEKGGGYTCYPSAVPLPFMQNSYYTSPPMQNMKFPDEMMMMTDIPSGRPSVEIRRSLHPQRFSSQPQSNDSFVAQHHPSSSVGSRRELWGSETEIMSGELSPVRQSPTSRADSVLQFAPRMSLDEPSMQSSHSPTVIAAFTSSTRPRRHPTFVVRILVALETWFEALIAGGVVLWSRSFTPEASHITSSAASPVNSLIREALIEGRTAEEKYEKDGYAVKWTFVNDLELIFVVAYQRILQLTYVDDLLTAMKALFIKLFEPFLATFVASLHAMNNGKPAPATARDTSTPWNFAKAFDGWDRVFDKLLKGIEEKAAQERKSRFRPIAHVEQSTPSTPSDDLSTLPSESPDVPQDEQQIARNAQALKDRLRGRGGGGRDGVLISDNESTKRKTKTKAGRKWGDETPSETDMASLDFSLDKADSGANGRLTHDLQSLVDEASLGTRTKDGLYEVKDWDFGSKVDETSGVIARALQSDASKQSASSLGALGSLFARLTGSKVLTEDDLKPVLEGMKQHLMKKNVAKEIADKVCEGVGESLVGKKVGGFQTTNHAVRMALSTSLTRILTPKTSTDLLLSIRTKLNSPLTSSQQRIPYSIVFVGVNGVGKSTNLSKVCFWLIQNGLRVLIAACDTFRRVYAGAVEQLRVHVRNLSMLGVDGATNSKGRVELYEKGYGKDAAGIAKEAIAHAKDNDFDVVLIDTAGRMQDNEPLMRALAKLVAVNNPDKILFVGEALVGNEAVDQLTKFDRALRDFSGASTGKSRGIDGMLITKWDTVDDKVGAALSMTYVTGQPIIFVGCGQTYTDLRQLRVSNVVQAILSD